MEKQNVHLSGQANTLIFKVITAIIVFFYLINCCTPLRLHVDMLRYFAIKDCIELGCPPDSDAAKDYMPLGYTALLLALSKLGMLKSYTIVLLNCLYLFGGIWLVRKIFSSAIHPFFFLTLVLLNWTIIKFVTHPLSEMQYFFFSTASVYLFYRYSQNRQVLFLLSAFALGALAFLTRSVGIALFAALISGLLWQYRKELMVLVRKHKILVVVVVLALIGVVAFSKQLGLDHYTGVFSKATKGDGVTFPTILKWHFTEWAEFCLNITIVKVEGYFPFSSGRPFFLVAGILFFFGFVYLLFIRKNNIPFIVKAYLLFYSLLMFNWPFYDPRFWVPVLPFVAAVVAESVRSARKAGKRVRAPLIVFLALYFTLGIASIGYITYTSLNRRAFARTQANGVYKNEYETFFYGRPLTDSTGHADPNIVDILKRYDR